MNHKEPIHIDRLKRVCSRREFLSYIVCCPHCVKTNNVVWLSAFTKNYFSTWPLCHLPLALWDTSYNALSKTGGHSDFLDKALRWHFIPNGICRCSQSPFYERLEIGQHHIFNGGDQGPVWQGKRRPEVRSGGNLQPLRCGQGRSHWLRKEWIPDGPLTLAWGFHPYILRKIFHTEHWQKDDSWL